MTLGRPTDYSEEMERKAIEYINGGYIAAGDAIPSVVGLACELNVSKSTVYKWAEDGRGDFSDTLSRCKDTQERKLLSGGLTSEFNATIVKLALANHGYSEKTETDITSKGESINNFIVQPVSTLDKLNKDD